MAPQPLAVVGMGCRFPGADSLDAYWALLQSGADGFSVLPEERRLWVQRLLPQESARWRGGFIDAPFGFDASYFHTAPREAQSMDPQQRLLLHCVAAAIEDGALSRRQLATVRTGVFAGVSLHDFSVLTWQRRADRYATPGTASSLAANRVSYWLGARGPSFAVDGACSSALVALHLARASLLAGECDVAICAAASIMLLPQVTASLADAGLVTDADYRAFDAGASGYLRGEGGGAMILRPLEAARRQRNRIYAVLLGSAVNHNGISNGIMAPSPQAQMQVVRDAYGSAGRRPGGCTYVEAMGAGTVLADTIELKALNRTVGQDREARQPSCLVGCVKNSIGHLEAASGIAGAIKVALALHHGQLPPTIGISEPNPYLSRSDVNLRLAREPESCRDAEMGVSSFGFGGANAHVVFATAPQPAEPCPDPVGAEAVLTLSAATPASGAALVDVWQEFLQATPAAPLDIGFSSNISRSENLLKLAVYGRNTSELAAALARRSESGMRRIAGRPVAFCFPSPDCEPHGRHHLLNRFVTVREISEQVCAEVREVCAATPASLCVEPEDEVERMSAGMLWSVVMARVWRRWGVRRDAWSAHGAGVFAAAVDAGVADLALALRAMRIAIRDRAGPDYRAAVDAMLSASARPVATVTDGAAIDEPAFWHALVGPAARGIAPVRVAAAKESCHVALGPCAEHDSVCIAAVLVRLFENGTPLDWDEIHRETGTRCVALPGYPFELDAQLPLCSTPSAGVDAADDTALLARLERILGDLGF